jgi:hypothetical protein
MAWVTFDSSQRISLPVHTALRPFTDTTDNRQKTSFYRIYIHVGTVRRVQYVSVCCPWCQWFPETEINLENTADLVGKSRENVESRGKMEKTLIKTVYFFKLDAKVRLLYKTLLVYKKST